MRDTTEILSAWNSFYVMIGSSAAALTGLMFVVITLIRDTERDATADGISTFSTPTVVHFGYVLFTAALMTAPFRSAVPVSIVLGFAGLIGIGYVVRTAHRTSKLTTYEPDIADFAWYIGLPLVAYAAMLGGAIDLRAAPDLALYAPATAVTLLIFVGIHNAWDVVTYLAMSRTGSAAANSKPERLPDGVEPAIPAQALDVVEQRDIGT